MSCWIRFENSDDENFLNSLFSLNGKGWSAIQNLESVENECIRCVRGVDHDSRSPPPMMTFKKIARWVITIYRRLLSQMWGLLWRADLQYKTNSNNYIGEGLILVLGHRHTFKSYQKLILCKWLQKSPLKVWSAIKRILEFWILKNSKLTDASIKLPEIPRNFTHLVDLFSSYPRMLHCQAFHIIFKRICAE